jgi:hypothetical protein
MATATLKQYGFTDVLVQALEKAGSASTVQALRNAIAKSEAARSLI